MFSRFFFYIKIQATLKKHFLIHRKLRTFKYNPSELARALVSSYKESFDPFFEASGIRPHARVSISYILAELSREICYPDQSYIGGLMVATHALHDTTLQSKKYQLKKGDWVLMLRAYKMLTSALEKNRIHIITHFGFEAEKTFKEPLFDIINFLVENSIYTETQIEDTFRCI